jgi:hypothetical protein
MLTLDQLKDYDLWHMTLNERQLLCILNIPFQINTMLLLFNWIFYCYNTMTGAILY